MKPDSFGIHVHYFRKLSRTLTNAKRSLCWWQLRNRLVVLWITHKFDIVFIAKLFYISKQKFLLIVFLHHSHSYQVFLTVFLIFMHSMFVTAFVYATKSSKVRVCVEFWASHYLKITQNKQTKLQTLRANWMRIVFIQYVRGAKMTCTKWPICLIFSIVTERFCTTRCISRDRTECGYFPCKSYCGFW